MFNTQPSLHSCNKLKSSQNEQTTHLSYSVFHSNRADRHTFHYCRSRGRCISDHNLRGHTWLLTSRTHTDNAASHTFRERILPHTLLWISNQQKRNTWMQKLLLSSHTCLENTPNPIADMHSLDASQSKAKQNDKN